MKNLVRLNTLYRAVFDRDINYENYDSKAKLHKLVYILQTLGIDLGYDFTWYIRGPHSIRLMDHGWEFTRREHKVEDKYDLNQLELDAIGKIRRAASLVNDSDNCELLASYLYLKVGYGSQGETIKELTVRKPRFSIPRIKRVIGQWNHRTTV